MIKQTWICHTCKHLNKTTMTCPAFPERIPLEPYVLPMLHDQILPTQVGDTVYERDPEDYTARMMEGFVRQAAENGEGRVPEEGEPAYEVYYGTANED